MDEKATLAELQAHLGELEQRAKDLASEFADRDFTANAEDEWAALKDEIAQTKDKIAKRQQRENDLAEMSQRDENTETEKTLERFSFQTRKPSKVPDDPTAIDEYRTRARDLDELKTAQADGARRILEGYRSAHPAVSKEEAQDDIDKLIERDHEVALRMIATSSPRYRKEFAQYVKTGVAGPEMVRAASLTTTAGGFAVPVELDTTLILTNAGVVNPIRRIARVRQTNVNTVQFINTNGITAAFAAEAAEASDDAPTLAQPDVNVEKAHAFVPMSIEIAEDWANIQSDIAMAFADAKDRLEANKFLHGLGHSSNQPQGLIAAGGATAVVTSASTATFAVADLYSLEIGLSPRYRPRASIVGNRAAFQKVRQFDTAGGANLWVQLQNDNPPTLLGYPSYEWSEYSSAVTTSGATILTIGDFNYFAIVDRVGMNVELIPHMFHTSNNRPSGQRGLYMYWRTSSDVLTPTLQANSAFVSLKLL